jgi:hypothetical protein
MKRVHLSTRGSAYLILCPHEQQWAWQKPPLPPRHQLSVLPSALPRSNSPTAHPRSAAPHERATATATVPVPSLCTWLPSVCLSLSLVHALPNITVYSCISRQKDATQREETREKKPMAHFITLCRSTLRTPYPVHSRTPAPRSPAALVSCRAVA